MRFKGTIVFLLGISLAVGYWVLHALYLYHLVELRLFGLVIETPVSVLILSTLVLSIVVMLLLKLLSLLIFFPSHLRNWKNRWNEKRRNRMLSDGLQAMVLGIKDSQYKHFLAAGDAGIEPATTYFLAAAMSTDQKKQSNLLRKAAKAEGDPMVKAMAVARARLLANQPADAAEVLRIAGAATHKAVQPMKLLLEATEKSGDIRGALDVATNLLDREKSPVLRHRVQQLTHKLLEEAGNAADVHGLLGNVYKSTVSHNANAVAIAAAARLVAVNDRPAASTILAQALKQNADADLFEAIAEYGNDELVQQALARSENMMRTNPDDTSLMRAVAELTMRKQLWGQARRMLEQAIGIREERATYLQLAKLAEAEGLSSDEANRLYRQAAQVADPEPA